MEGVKTFVHAGKIHDGRFRQGVMQELVQWSGNDTLKLDVEQPSKDSDRLSIRESLPTHSKVVTLYLPKEVEPRKIYADAMKRASSLRMEGNGSRR